MQVSCDALKSLIVGLSASVGSAGEGVDGEGDIGSSAQAIDEQSKRTSVQCWIAWGGVCGRVFIAEQCVVEVKCGRHRGAWVCDGIVCELEMAEYFL